MKKSELVQKLKRADELRLKYLKTVNKIADSIKVTGTSKRMQK